MEVEGSNEGNYWSLPQSDCMDGAGNYLFGGIFRIRIFSILVKKSARNKNIIDLF